MTVICICNKKINYELLLKVRQCREHHIYFESWPLTVMEQLPRETLQLAPVKISHLISSYRVHSLYSKFHKMTKDHTKSQNDLCPKDESTTGDKISY